MAWRHGIKVLSPLVALDRVFAFCPIFGMVLEVQKFAILGSLNPQLAS